MAMGPAPGVGKYPPSAMQLTPADLGMRVTVRSAVDDGFSDTIGELVTFSPSTMLVRRRDGALVTLETRRIVAARVVR